jgi:tetratricopeptide (TPR) repeat protein
VRGGALSGISPRGALDRRPAVRAGGARPEIRNAHRASAVWAGVVALALWTGPGTASAGIFDREQEDVAAGNRALAEGDAAEALRRYEAAAREHGDAPEVAHDRGAALLAAGRHEEALAAFGEALARRGEGPAAAADHAGRGTALANLGRLEEAKAELRKALELDPDQETARRNLEALLRRQEREEEQQQDSPQQEEQQDSGEQQDSQEQQAGNESGEEQEPQAGNQAEQPQDGESNSGQEQSSEEQAKDGSRQQDEQQAEDQPRDGSGNDPRPSEPQPGEENEPRPDGAQAEAPQQDPGQQAATGEGEEPPNGTGIPQAAGPAESAAPAGPIDRTEAEQLLDALQAGERPFQLYRRQRRRGERTDHDKDW